jgi:RNA 3'-terminal phosphate cyclase (ATP)
MVTGKPFRVENIRGKRDRPGLLRQHLTAVKAAQQIAGADVVGAELGSTTLTFQPGTVRSGDYEFAVGSAGSTTLVFQTILPALLVAGGPSTLTLEGGTHNQAAPPFDFLERSFLPILAKMGVAAQLTLNRPGFYPAGGGSLTVRLSPVDKLAPIELMERGQLKKRCAEAVFANLSADIAERELKVVRELLNLLDDELHVRGEYRSAGPGNVLLLTFGFDQLTEVFSGFGQLGVSAETVAKRASQNARRYLASTAAVGPHLADQLLLPMALAGGGKFTTLRPSLHAITNMEVIRRFVSVDIDCQEIGGGVWRVEVGGGT